MEVLFFMPEIDNDKPEYEPRIFYHEKFSDKKVTIQDFTKLLEEVDINIEQACKNMLSMETSNVAYRIVIHNGEGGNNFGRDNNYLGDYIVGYLDLSVEHDRTTALPNLQARYRKSFEDSILQLSSKISSSNSKSLSEKIRGEIFIGGTVRKS